MKYKNKSLILAQCDAHATSFLVQRDDLLVQSMVDKISESEYSENLPIMHFTKNLILCCDKANLRRKKTSSSLGRIDLVAMICIMLVKLYLKLFSQTL